MRLSDVWGIIPAAGAGTRIQPLAFSKELLPVGSRRDLRGTDRPRAVSEYLMERLLAAGVRRVCFVISPWKSDILQYFGGHYGDAAIAYAIQDEPRGLCDAVFRAAPLVGADQAVIIGLPDTVWFPDDALADLPEDRLSLLLFPVRRPELFDAVALHPDGRVREIEVKSASPSTHWIWGAIRIPGHIFHALHDLWQARSGRDEYLGTLLNAWFAAGNDGWGVRRGTSYVDVGTLHGWHAALDVLKQADEQPASPFRPAAAVHRLGVVR